MFSVGLWVTSFAEAVQNGSTKEAFSLTVLDAYSLSLHLKVMPILKCTQKTRQFNSAADGCTARVTWRTSNIVYTLPLSFEGQK